MELKFAATTCVVFHNGQRRNLAEDDAWDANDSLVKAHPDLFADTPRRVFGTGARPVEQATAAPGERRTTKRG